MNTRTTLGAVALATLPALAAAHVPLPQPKTEGMVTYLSGGIGSDEALAMRQAAQRYPLSMVFSAGRHNEFVADVYVTIKDKSGKTVLNTVAEGPIMLAKLPPGEYSVIVDMDGKTLRRKAEVSAKGDIQESFHWPHA